MVLYFGDADGFGVPTGPGLVDKRDACPCIPDGRGRCLVIPIDIDDGSGTVSPDGTIDGIVYADLDAFLAESESAGVWLEYVGAEEWRVQPSFGLHFYQCVLCGEVSDLKCGDLNHAAGGRLTTGSLPMPDVMNGRGGEIAFAWNAAELGAYVEQEPQICAGNVSVNPALYCPMVVRVGLDPEGNLAHEVTFCPLNGSKCQAHPDTLGLHPRGFCPVEGPM